MKLKPRIVAIRVPLLTGEESLMTLTRWLVTVGASVEIDQDLVELDINGEPFLLPSPLDGKLIAIETETEAMVEPGQVLALIEAD
jgi:2-oxoglutarate dehydrogenase E2 component (dihydrolipoamide succinyltransferase)